MPTEARLPNSPSEGWSGRRGSNPRPTAWKAVTLPLSYSRLRASSAPLLGASAGKPAAPLPTLHDPPITRLGLPTVARLRRKLRRAKVGGEGRVRTSVATWAADLQSAAIDRSATSPIQHSCCASRHDRSGSQRLNPLRPCALALEPAHVMESVYPVYL